MVVIQQAPNQISTGRVDLDANKFDNAVYEKGYPVTWESALKCPCKLDGRGHLPTCINCGGAGWVFINPVKTKMVIQSMNISTKYAQWSVEKVGIAQITTRSVDNVGDMDRITLDESISKMSQIVRPKLYKGKLFAFTHYPIIKIIDVFVFKADDKKLVRLKMDQYSSERNKLILNKNLFEDDLSVTIRYQHPVQYYIVDIAREVRETHILDLSKENLTKLPVSAVGRRCHHVLRPEEYDLTQTVDNSYE